MLLEFRRVLFRSKSETSAPITFIYCPTLPYMDNGEFKFQDPNQATVERFADACKRHGISFLNTDSAFIEHFDNLGELTRGFSNTPPGEGHLNKNGHRITAIALFNHFKGGGNAILQP